MHILWHFLGLYFSNQDLGAKILARGHAFNTDQFHSAVTTCTLKSIIKRQICETLAINNRIRYYHTNINVCHFHEPIVRKYYHFILNTISLIGGSHYYTWYVISVPNLVVERLKCISLLHCMFGANFNVCLFVLLLAGVKPCGFACICSMFCTVTVTLRIINILMCFWRHFACLCLLSAWEHGLTLAGLGAENVCCTLDLVRTSLSQAFTSLQALLSVYTRCSWWRNRS